jgi:hypothetical protein
MTKTDPTPGLECHPLHYISLYIDEVLDPADQAQLDQALQWVGRDPQRMLRLILALIARTHEFDATHADSYTQVGAHLAEGSEYHQGMVNTASAIAQAIRASIKKR